jgi:hypothetical protein
MSEHIDDSWDGVTIHPHAWLDWLWELEYDDE